MRWSDTALEQVHPGRGLHRPLPDRPKKAPSATKVFTDVTAAMAKQAPFTQPIDPAEVPETLVSAWDRLHATLALKGKEGATAELDVDAQALAWVIASARKNRYETARTPHTHRLVRHWLRRHDGGFAVRALATSWRMQLTFDGGGWRGNITNPRLWRFDEWTASEAFDQMDWRDPDVNGTQYLREALAFVEDASYASAVAAVRELWPQAPLKLRTALAYVVPTEQDLAQEVFDAFTSEQIASPEGWMMLVAQSLADPEPLAAAFRVHPQPYGGVRWLWPLLGTVGEAAHDPLVALYDEKHEHVVLTVVAHLPSPEVADRLATFDDADLRESFFMDQPELAAAHLAQDDPLRAAVMRLHPHLDPNAAPVASDEELPEPLREAHAVRSKKALPPSWKPVADLYLRGREKVLDGAAFERLGLLLRKHNGELSPPTRAVREALDPEASDAFALALLDSFGWQTGGENRWVYRSMMVFGHDQLVDRMSAQVTKIGYADGVAGLQILAGIASERALLRVAHVANRGRGGLKNAAKAQLHAIARARGLSQAELDDRLVPDLGLDATGRMTLDYGPRQFTVGFDEKLAPLILDGEGKPRKSLPKPGKKDDAELAPASEKRFKDLKKTVRTLASVQVARFETGMIEQRRWPVEDWRRYVARHPLLTHLAQRLVWGRFDGETLAGTFRVDESQAAVDHEDEPIAFADDAKIGILHPLLLPAETLEAWSDVWSDYGLLQPFLQLARPTYVAGSPQAEALMSAVQGMTVPGGRVAGLLNRQWSRGAVQDAGQYYSVHKRIGALTIEVQMDHGLNISGGYGFDMDQTLQVKVSQRGRDKPSPVAYSEALYGLSSLVG